MAPYTCPTCLNDYVDILDHIRKKHPEEPYTALQLQPLGLTPCPICHTACRGEHGVKTHSAKIHGTIGTSRVSTLHRVRTYIPQIAAAFSPAIGSVPRLPQPPRHPIARNSPIHRPESPRGNAAGKRPARSPSPGTQRPPLRQRLAVVIPLKL